MISIKNTIFYSEVLKELNYHFGDFYFFEGFVVSEIKEGVNFSWDYAKIVIHEVSQYYNTKGKEIVYLSNRIHNYNVKPVDWLKYTMHAFKLKGYGIVVNSNVGRKNALFESIFIPTRFKTFTSTLDGIQWAAQINEVDEVKKKK
ncbi:MULTISPECIES: hypothetical protein [unclassified Nonlabens]|uniref:hypothetical protein n=1 Tax=unclassified Nonlabens TaxID=2615035 RepID=UPI0038706930